MTLAVFAFADFNELLLMGGHGVYVWSAWLIVLCTLIALAWWPYYKIRQLLKPAPSKP